MADQRLQHSHWLTLVLAVAALCFQGCNRNGQTAPPAMPPPEVAVLTVTPEHAPVSVEYVGQIAGSREVEVRARVTGILLKRNYTEGGMVQEGQSLFTIDPAPFQVALARTAAELAGAEARQAQAERNVERLKSLLKTRTASQKDYDDALSAAQIAAADVKAAQAARNEAQLNLDYTRVESPLTGIASRALKSEGSLVSGPDVLLTTVISIDPVYVNFGIPALDQLKLKREVESGRLTQPIDDQFDISVQLADGSVYDHTGKLGFTDARVNTTTGTIDARAILPNPRGILQSGQFVRVRLSGAVRQNAILVPQRAVLEGPQGKFVYVVNGEGKAESRPVEVGDWTSEAWVINQGLQAGERVIVDGVMKIGPGVPVRVAETGTPAPEKAPTARDGHPRSTTATN